MYTIPYYCPSTTSPYRSTSTESHVVHVRNLNRRRRPSTTGANSRYKTNRRYARTVSFPCSISLKIAVAVSRYTVGTIGIDPQLFVGRNRPLLWAYISVPLFRIGVEVDLTVTAGRIETQYPELRIVGVKDELQIQVLLVLFGSVVESDFKLLDNTAPIIFGDNLQSPAEDFLHFGKILDFPVRFMPQVFRRLFPGFIFLFGDRSYPDAEAVVDPYFQRFGYCLIVIGIRRAAQHGGRDEAQQCRDG